jgi:GTPase SAR1 family protein
MQDHCKASKRTMHVGNLDPAAEFNDYNASLDIKDLVSLDDVMEELGFGPNGGLVYCMEYLLSNNDWLKDELDSFGEDEYIILDCPGQVELYSHLPVMHDLAKLLTMWGYKVVSVYILDALTVLEPSKFVSGIYLSIYLCVYVLACQCI